MKYIRRRSNSVCFFHPNCSDCGGGEKVLWVAVESFSKRYGKNLYIYSSSGHKEKLFEVVKQRFSIELSPSINIIDVGPASFLAKNRFPRFTLILQSIYSIIYAFKCLNKHVPSVVIDTTGAPFASFVWKLFGGCKVILYIHYPFISTDMLNFVKSSNIGYNNNERIAKSKLLTSLKVIYYNFIAIIYSYVGSVSDVIMVNSKWTSNHIEEIFKKSPTIVYPPCDTEKYYDLPLTEKRIKGQILSLQQFRPEKDIPLQLDIIEAVYKKHPNVKLYIAGGIRNEDDKALSESIQKVIDDKKLPVTLLPNIDSKTLKEYLETSDIGLHTMYNEHFGICVVEFMASGIIPVANSSAGPLLDTVQDTDYLALTLEEYVSKLENALTAGKDVREKFRNQSKRFSNQAFQDLFLKSCEPILSSVKLS